MTKTITDITSELVVPYWRHFGEMGMAPRLLGAEIEIVKFERVESPRLGMLLLKPETAKGLLANIYGRLGRNLAYIAKWNVNHNDLHTENIVVTKDNTPIVIDWEKAAFMGLSGKGL